MNPRLWDFSESSWLHTRTQNMIGQATLTMVDDTNPVQLFQSVGYPTEVRGGMHHPGTFGFGAVPLPGAKAVVGFQGGSRGRGAASAIFDPRYRPTGYHPGESYQYMVDGANPSTGLGGTTRMLLQGVAGWLTTLFGKTISLGDANAQTINVGTAAASVTINMGSSSAAVNITGGSGDVKVNGISLVNHVHSGVTPGGGETGAPVG